MALTKVIGAGLGTVSSADLDGAVTINESSADKDFRVESDNNANAFFVQGSSGNIGLGTSSPGNELHIYNTSYPSIRFDDGTAYSNIYNDSTDGSLVYSADDQGGRADSKHLFYVDGAEKMRIHTNGVASFNNGIALGVGTANTSSNVIDDYEEGAFTAQLSTDSTYTGDTAQAGVYTKIGDICFIQIRFQTTGTINRGVNARFGLPFTAANNGVQAAGFRGSVENIDTSVVGIGATIAANNTILYLNEMTAATTGHNLNGSDLGANFQVQIQGFYKTT